jgi:hypothetical protein
MATVYSSQRAPWDAVDLLQMINSDVDGWTCVGYATSLRRRCRNRIKRQNISEAKGILTVLPSIADNSMTLQQRLATLASQTLCTHPHSKSSEQHTLVIARWTKIIDREQALRRSALPLSGYQDVVQPIGEQHLDPILLRPGHFRQSVPAASNSCTICLDDVGSNGGCKTLSCRHVFCRGCIDRWWNVSHSCPICRDDGIERGADEVGSSPRSVEPQQGADDLEESLQHNNTPPSNESRDSARNPVEQARGLSVEPQQALTREHRAGRETSTEHHILDRSSDVAPPIGSFVVSPSLGDCGICLEAIGQNGGLRTLQCSHTFCTICISRWLRQGSRCPYRCEPDRRT